MIALPHLCTSEIISLPCLATPFHAVPSIALHRLAVPSRDSIGLTENFGEVK